MKHQIQRSVLALTLVAIIAGFSWRESLVSAQKAVDFNREVRPILSDNCFTCHGPDDKERKARLRFDTKEGAFAKQGVIIAGDAANSRLMKRITATSPDLIMPPLATGHKLTPQQIETMRRWIEEGAKWDEHWAFVTPQRPEVPTVKDITWVKNPVDNFVLARLEKEKLKPSPEADKVTLL
jgi:mono/diheme cytochrome c family protein